MKDKTVVQLGGSGFQVPVLQVAQREGVRVILVDQNPACPGREYADHFVPISTTEPEQILKALAPFSIDGVMTYASDVSAPSVAFLAEKLGLPGHPLKAAHLLQRKDRIRELQQSLALPTPASISVRTAAEAITAYQQLGGKVICKPVDSSGSRGQSVVNTPDQIEKAFHKAIRESRAQIVVIERFLTSDMLELDGDLLIHDGQVYFAQYGHNYFLSNPLAGVPVGEVFPGFFSEDICAEITRQFNVLIKALNLADGCLNFDGIVSDGKVYLVDIGLRNGGNFVPLLIEQTTQFPLTKAALLAALGLPPPPISAEKNYSAGYLIHAKESGRYTGYALSDELAPYCVGSRVFSTQAKPFTEGSCAIGALFFSFPDQAVCQALLPQIEHGVEFHIETGDVLC